MAYRGAISLYIGTSKRFVFLCNVLKNNIIGRRELLELWYRALQGTLCEGGTRSQLNVGGGYVAHCEPFCPFAKRTRDKEEPYLNKSVNNINVSDVLNRKSMT